MRGCRWMHVSHVVKKLIVLQSHASKVPRKSGTHVAGEMYIRTPSGCSNPIPKQKKVPLARVRCVDHYGLTGHPTCSDVCCSTYFLVLSDCYFFPSSTCPRFFSTSASQIVIFCCSLLGWKTSGGCGRKFQEGKRAYTNTHTHKLC